MAFPGSKSTVLASVLMVFASTCTREAANVRPQEPQEPQAAQPTATPPLPYAQRAHTSSGVAVVVELFATGTVRVDGISVDADEKISEAARAAVAAEPATVGLLLPAPSVPAARRTEVTNLLSRAGIKSITLVELADDEPYAAADALPTRLPPVIPSPEKLPSAPSWSCFVPRQADIARVDSAAVVLRALVNADGTARSIWLLQDPGYGYARVAAACAKRVRYQPATDAAGQPVDAMTPPIRVSFIR